MPNTSRNDEWSWRGQRGEEMKRKKTKSRRAKNDKTYAKHVGGNYGKRRLHVTASGLELISYAALLIEPLVRALKFPTTPNAVTMPTAA